MRMIFKFMSPVAVTIAATAVLLALTTMTGGCASTNRVNDSEAPPRPAMLNHVVFFELHDPVDAPALIEDCDTKLAAIPGITSYYCGTPIDTGRDTVLDDYDVGFYVGFDSIEDYDNYVVHPNHIEVVNDWRPRLKALRVYDIHDNTP